MKNSVLLPYPIPGSRHGHRQDILLATSIKQANNMTGYVQVKGLSEREVHADLAVWPINAVLTGNDLNALKEQY